MIVAVAVTGHPERHVVPLVLRLAERLLVLGRVAVLAVHLPPERLPRRGAEQREGRLRAGGVLGRRTTHHTPSDLNSVVLVVLPLLNQ